MTRAFTANCVTSCIAFSMSLSTLTCASSSSTNDAFGNDTLMPGDALVLAMNLYAGFLTDPAEPFFNNRRGAHAVYLYANRKVIRTTPNHSGAGPCREYQTFQLEESEFSRLVGLIDSTVAKADGISYRACNPLDAGGVGLYARWGNVTVHTGAAPCFNAASCCSDIEWTGDSPPDHLVELANALQALGQREGSDYTSEVGAVLMGCKASQDLSGCATAATVTTPPLGSPSFAAPCSYDQSKQPVLEFTAEETDSLETAMQPHMWPDRTQYPTALVQLDGSCTILACDLVLPHEADVQ